MVVKQRAKERRSTFQSLNNPPYGITPVRRVFCLLPSQSQAPAGHCDSSPAGGAECTPVGAGSLCGKIRFLYFALPQTLPLLTVVHLPPPAGEVARRVSAVTERVASPSGRGAAEGGGEGGCERRSASRA